MVLKAILAALQGQAAAEQADLAAPLAEAPGQDAFTMPPDQALGQDVSAMPTVQASGEDAFTMPTVQALGQDAFTMQSAPGQDAFWMPPGQALGQDAFAMPTVQAPGQDASTMLPVQAAHPPQPTYEAYECPVNDPWCVPVPTCGPGLPGECMPACVPAFLNPAYAFQVGDCVMATTEIRYGDQAVPPRTAGVVATAGPALPDAPPRTKGVVAVEWDGPLGGERREVLPEQLSKMDDRIGKIVAVRVDRADVPVPQPQPHADPALGAAEYQGQQGPGAGFAQMAWQPQPLVKCLSHACHASVPGQGSPVMMDACRNTAEQEFVLPACGHGRIRPKCMPSDCMNVVSADLTVFASCAEESGSNISLSGSQLEAHLPDGTSGCLDLRGPYDSELVVVPCAEAATQFTFA